MFFSRTNRLAKGPRRKRSKGQRGSSGVALGRRLRGEALEDRRMLAVTLVSDALDGYQDQIGNGYSDVTYVDRAISGNGRYVAFRSDASNLVAGDTNNRADIFVKDLDTGVTTRVSTDSAGNQGFDHSFNPSISADGRYVAFYSYASNLVTGDTNGAADIFVKDLHSGVTTRVSTDSAGIQGNNSSYIPSISADGSSVAFQSIASNLVTGDTNGRTDIFVKNLLTGVTTRVSTDSAGSQGNSDSIEASISADGSSVAFQSYAANLVASDTNGQADIFVKNLATGVTTRVSTDSGGNQANRSSHGASISADGTSVAFASSASNLATGDANKRSDIFVKDLNTGATTRVSIGSGVKDSNHDSYNVSISADGNLVAFSSYASNLVTGDTNGQTDVFVKNLNTGVMILVSTDATGGPANSQSDLPSISADGRYVAFYSSANDLLDPGVDINGTLDVFRTDLQTGDTVLVSSVASLAGNGYSDITPVDRAISANGRYVAFRSDASNLVEDDFNFRSDIFVKDLQTGVTTRVSTDSAGNQANDFSFNPSISADGRYVAFSSYASNLVAGDTNGRADIFVKDLATGTTTLVSTDASNDQGNNNSFNPSISADGNSIAFYSLASNLVSDDTNGLEDIFVKDLNTGFTIRVSTGSDGTQGNDRSYLASISADGSAVAFYSRASNLVPGDTNGELDVFVKDLETGVTTLVSTDSSGNQGNNYSYSPSISADGRSVAFTSLASNLAPDDTNGRTDVFVKNLDTGVTSLVNTDSAGNQGNFDAYDPSISADGNSIAFRGYATNLVAGDVNGRADIFVKNLATGVTTRVSTDADGNGGNSDSYYPSISGDGKYVAFRSHASNFVEGDINNDSDVFLAGPLITNEPPIADIGGPYSGDEAATVTLDASASTDPDQDASTLTFEWDFDNDGQFDDAIGATANLTLVDGPDSVSVAVRVTDDEGESDIASTVVTVNNAAPLNEADNAAVAVDEGQTASNAGTFSDPGADDVTLTASVGAVIDNGDGTWSWSFDTADGPDESQTVTITATDSDGAATAATFELTVNNVKPTLADAAFTIAENTSDGTYVGTVTGSDPGDDTLSYAIVGGSGETAFAIDATSGEITVADSAQLDYEASTVLDLTVEVSDEDGAVGSATVTIDLTNITAVISGTVFVDVDGDGLFDGGTEIGLDGVAVTLYEDDGTTAVATDVTELGGVYAFTVDDELGTFHIVETQPTGVDEGAAIVGDANDNGVTGEAADGSALSANELQLTLTGVDASDYDFTESGQAVQSGDTATIGFWQNKNGQALIESGGDSLVDWLSTNFDNVFGNTFSDGAGGDDAGEVADFYKSEFFKKKIKGTPKVDAQFMSLALATYFTSSTLAGGDGASDYGFNVTETGIGAKVVNVGESGEAFNAADYADLAIMSLLQATNDLTGADADWLDGESYSHVYDYNGDGDLDAQELEWRAMANEVYSSINEAGDI